LEVAKTARRETLKSLKRGGFLFFLKDREPVIARKKEPPGREKQTAHRKKEGGRLVLRLGKDPKGNNGRGGGNVARQTLLMNLGIRSPIVNRWCGAWRPGLIFRGGASLSSERKNPREGWGYYGRESKAQPPPEKKEQAAKISMGEEPHFFLIRNRGWLLKRRKSFAGEDSLSDHAKGTYRNHS